jgi:hypothetical protein
MGLTLSACIAPPHFITLAAAVHAATVSVVEMEAATEDH